MPQVLDFVDEHFKGKWKRQGNNVLIATPEKLGKKYSPSYEYNEAKKKLSIDIESGKWQCFLTGAKGGNIKSLAYQLGIVQLQEPVEAPHIVLPHGKIEAYRKALKNNKEALNFLYDVRGFSKASVHQFRLGYCKLNGMDAITIPYFDKNDVCVGLKYYFYNRPEGHAKMSFEKGSKIQFYNLEAVTLEEPVIITEGEFDAISLWQYGFRNVGSMPTGANGIGDWVEEIAGASKYILAVDSDQVGNQGATKLAERLGISRCSRVYPRSKDFNDYLQYGVSLKEIQEDFNKAKPMYSAPATSLSQFTAEAIDYLENKTQHVGCPTGWKSVDDIIGGWRLGEFTILTGGTSNGKSTWLEVACGEMNKHSEWGWKFLIISGEEKGSKVLRTLASNHCRRNATREDILNFQADNEGKFHIYNIYDEWDDKNDQIPLNQLFATVEYYILQHKVNFIVIDHAHLFINEGENEIQDIRFICQKIRRLVATHPVHIALVVQPTKIQKDQRKIQMKNLRGSVIWEQSAWNVLTIHREDDAKHLVEIEVEKNRELGTRGTTVLQFDPNSKANYYDV